MLPVTVTIGNKAATVTYAGGAPGIIAGVWQVNVQVPSGLAAGNVPVQVTVGGVSSPAGSDCSRVGELAEQVSGT